MQIHRTAGSANNGPPPTNNRGGQKAAPGGSRALHGWGLASVVVVADLVADAADGADEGVVGAGIDFAAEGVDVDVHHIGDGIAVNPPDFLDDRRTGYRAAWIAEEEFEKGVFLGAEFYGTTGSAHFVRDAIHFEVFELEDFARGTVAPPQNSADAGNQLRPGERLDDDVVGPRVQALDAFLNRTGGR